VGPRVNAKYWEQCARHSANSRDKTTSSLRIIEFPFLFNSAIPEYRSAYPLLRLALPCFVFGRAQGQGADTCLLEKRTINFPRLPPDSADWKTIINHTISYLADVLRRVSGLVPRIRETKKTTSSLPSLLPHDAEPTSLLLRKRRARTRSVL
jgi:hypothetical protein